MENVVVIDNGAYTLKVAHSKLEGIRCLPNGIFKAKNDHKKDFISGELSKCKDFSCLYYQLPFQRGYLLNWDVQRRVWDYTFGKEVLDLDKTPERIIMTEPHFNFLTNKEVMNEILFEDYGFEKVLRTNPSTLACKKYMSANPKEKCCLVVDSGYSFTHIVPYHNGVKLSQAVCRIDIGGKFLTNHLKEVISFRQLQVMDETYVINELKEDACYVSNEFDDDVKTCTKKGSENTVLRHYVLPDYTKIHRGIFKDPFNDDSTYKSQQMLKLTSERFSVPEVLFHPSDISIDQMGLPEAIFHSVNLSPSEMRVHLLRNIVLTGGNFNLTGFRQRLFGELRKLIPDDYELNITLPDNPITYAAEGGSECSSSPDLPWVSSKEFLEHGSIICEQKFGHI